jgi:hypothetical protein
VCTIHTGVITTATADTLTYQHVWNNGNDGKGKVMETGLRGTAVPRRGQALPRADWAEANAGFLPEGSEGCAVVPLLPPGQEPVRVAVLCGYCVWASLAA